MSFPNSEVYGYTCRQQNNLFFCCIHNKLLGSIPIAIANQNK